jgi:cytochrome c556
MTTRSLSISPCVALCAALLAAATLVASAPTLAQSAADLQKQRQQMFEEIDKALPYVSKMAQSEPQLAPYAAWQALVKSRAQLTALTAAFKASPPRDMLAMEQLRGGVAAENKLADRILKAVKTVDESVKRFADYNALPAHGLDVDGRDSGAGNYLHGSTTWWAEAAHPMQQNIHA